MFCLSSLCFMCLNHEDAENFIVLQHAGNELVQQVMFVLPEVKMLDSRLPLLMCSTCRGILDAFHNFKKMCVDNSWRYNDYINKLMQPNGNSKQTTDELEVKISENIQLTNVKEEENIDSNIVELDTEKNLVEAGIDIKEEPFSISEDKTNILYLQILEKETKLNNVQECNRNDNFGNQIIIEEMQCSNQEMEINEKTLVSKLKEEGKIDSNIEILYVDEHFLEDGINIKEEEFSISEGDDNLIYVEILEKESESNNMQEGNQNVNFGNQIIIEVIQYGIEEVKTNENTLPSNSKEEVNTDSDKIQYVEENLVEDVVDIKDETFSISEDNTNLSDTQIINDTDSNSVGDNLQNVISGDQVTEEDIHSSKQKFIKNKLQYKTKYFKCSVCKGVFVNKLLLLNHLKEGHANENDKKCLICNNVFANTSFWVEHMESHIDNDVKCSICGIIVENTVALHLHMKCHAGANDAICYICNKIFLFNSELHLVTHKDVKDNKCSVCNKLYESKKLLKPHMLIHQGIKRHKCSMCNKRFIGSSDLKRHMTIHTGKKDYKCDMCNKMFTRSMNLKYHMKTHTGEKDFQCVICNKMFWQKMSLNHHLKRTHSGKKKATPAVNNKNYKCSVCNKAYMSNNALKHHMRNKKCIDIEVSQKL